MNVQHSSRTDRWFTPVPILDRVKKVLGEIDLDPASEAQANERVGAKKFYTEKDDGLTQDWSGTIFCNPPGGKIGNKSKTAIFWQKLMETRADWGRLRHAIFLCFSLEALQSTQGKGVPSIGEFAFCVPAKRLCFDFPAGNASYAPSHSNAIVYVPGHYSNRTGFVNAFSDIGIVVGAV